jgi:hypothetical protein
MQEIERLGEFVTVRVGVGASGWVGGRHGMCACARVPVNVCLSSTI